MELHGLEKVIFNKPEQCDSCGSELEYIGIGRYRCISCGKELLDDYGIIKEYFRTHGSAPLLTVARETGMSKEKIKYILDGNYTEVPTTDKRAINRALFADNYKKFMS